MQASSKARAGIQSVEVGFALLDALAHAQGPQMLRDLAAAAGMRAAKAHRYLVSFQRLGLVSQDLASSRYDLGPAALQLGLAAISRLDAVRRARERMPELKARTGHTVALAVWGNQGPTLVHWEEAARAVVVSLRLGDVMPLLSSATGRCFAAWVSRAASGPLLQAEIARARLLGRSDLPQDDAALEALLQEVRQQGLARAVGSLLPGVAGFCAPVFDFDGHLVLGLVALGSLADFETDWQSPVARALRETAQALSAELGWRSA